MIYATDKATQQEIDLLKGKDYKRIKTVKTIVVDGVEVNLYKPDFVTVKEVKSIDAFGGDKNDWSSNSERR